MLLYESNEFRATKDWPYAISAGCVVYRVKDGKISVLLLRRLQKSDTWSAGDQEFSHHLPKGHVGFEESLTAAAKRETEEESGCEVQIKSYLGSITWDILHPKAKIPVVKTVHYFVAKYVDDAQAMDKEHDAKVWVPIDEAEKLLGKPNPKGENEIIKRFKKYLELTND